MGAGSGWACGAGGRPELVNVRAGQARPGQDVWGVARAPGGWRRGWGHGAEPGVWRERQRAGRDSEGAVA